MNMNLGLWIPIFRQMLQVIGGWMIASGWLDDASLDMVIGIVINLISFVWWYVSVHKTKKQVVIRKNGEIQAVVKQVVDEATEEPEVK